MPHPLVLQLRFTRSEFKRALRGLKAAEARKRFMPMNCISWNVGHLAWQEQRYFLFYGQDQMPLPHVDTLFASGAPGIQPALAAMWAAWDEITQAADPYNATCHRLSGRACRIANVMEEAASRLECTEQFDVEIRRVKVARELHRWRIVNDGRIGCIRCLLDHIEHVGDDLLDLRMIE